MENPAGQSFFVRYRLQFAQLLLLATLTSIAYSNTIHNDFVFDDKTLYQNSLRWTSLSWENLINVWQGSIHGTRPIANLTLALDNYFHQFAVEGYHLENTIIHIFSGILLFLLIKTTISLPSMCGKGYSISWLPIGVALVWTLHPVQTQSVTYVIQRMNSLAAMFYLASLYAYVRGRLTGIIRVRFFWFFLAILAGLSALGSKEISATLPLFIVLYELYFINDFKFIRSWKNVFLLGTGFLLFVVAAFFFFYSDNLINGLLAGYEFREFNLIERLLTESRVVIFYISLLFFPDPGRMNLDHDFMISRSLLAPSTTLLSMLILITLFGLAVYLARHHRLYSFCILWFLGNLVIESTIVPLELAFEHRLYLPSMMAVLLLVCLFSENVRKPKIIITVAFVVIVALTGATYQRNKVWRDDMSIWTDVVAKSPEKARGHSNLGVFLFRKGAIDEAAYHSLKSFNLDPEMLSTLNNLGNIMVAKKQYSEAIGYYQKALIQEPDSSTAYVGLGNALFGFGRFHESREHYLKALELQPGMPTAEDNLSLVNDRIQTMKKTEAEHGAKN